MNVGRHNDLYQRQRRAGREAFAGQKPCGRSTTVYLTRWAQDHDRS